MQSLRHTIYFILDLELNQKTQNEPIMFSSYYNLIEGNFHSEHANSIIFEDKVQQSALICAGTIKCHIKTSIFDHFIVSMGGFRQFVLVKNENVTIGPAIPVCSKPWYEPKRHSQTRPHYIGYCQTSKLTELPDISPKVVFEKINNHDHRYNSIHVGKIIGYIHDTKNHRYFLVNPTPDVYEIVAQSHKIDLPYELQSFLKCSAHFYKGNRCEIVSTSYLQNNIWHNINCAGAELVNHGVSAKYMFATNLNDKIIHEICSDKSLVIDDIINFNDYMSQYKGETK